MRIFSKKLRILSRKLRIVLVKGNNYEEKKDQNDVNIFKIAKYFVFSSKTTNKCDKQIIFINNSFTNYSKPTVCVQL